jgi:hypothetical protein
VPSHKKSLPYYGSVDLRKTGFGLGFVISLESQKPVVFSEMENLILAWWCTFVISALRRLGLGI